MVSFLDGEKLKWASSGLESKEKLNFQPKFPFTLTNQRLRNTKSNHAQLDMAILLVLLKQVNFTPGASTSMDNLDWVTRKQDGLQKKCFQISHSINWRGKTK
jgi:hypothetical protein